MSTSCFARCLVSTFASPKVKPLGITRYLSNSVGMVMKPTPLVSARDPNTLSNYNVWRTKHTTANFTIDFEKKSLVGTVLLKLQKLTKGEDKIVLDTR